MKKILLLTLLFIPLTAFSWVLPKGNLDGSDWDSNTLKGKTYFLIYVSPSSKDLNEDATDAIKAEKFSEDHFASVAIVDLKSSWAPNFLIVNAIKKKQEKYPRTLYLKDRKNHIPKLLNFDDSGNDIFVFNKEGKEIYRHLGKLNKEDIAKLIETLKAETVNVSK